MTLLSRGITSSQQGLSYLDRAIAKAEANDQELKSNVNLYNDTLEGFKSSSTYLGTRSRNILNEYSKAFESAVDMYAADPSEENQQRVDNIKLQTLDFYNRAVAARQNSLNQLNTFKANQFDYNFSLEEAMQQFSQAEDTDVSARFDMNSMEMLVGEGESQQTIGNVGYYNGNEPLYYSKRSSLGTAVAEGYWATQNYDTFASVIGTEDGKEKIVDAYKSKARFSESDQMTAIFNYVQDKKGVDLSKIKNNEELLMHINAVRNDGAELDKAFSHMAELEYNWMVGAKAAKALEAQAKTFNETYSGQITSRGERPSEEGPLYTRVGGVEGEMYKDPYNGLAEVRQLVTPIKVTDESAGVSGLSQYGDVLTGYDVDALSNIVITVDKVEQDPEDEEKSIIKRGQIHVLEPGSGDLYTNLKNDLVRKGLFSVLQRQSMARQASHEQEVNDRRIALAYANSGEEAPLPELRIDITAKDIEAAMTPPARQETKTEEELDFRGGKEIISAPRGYKEDQVVALNEKFVNNLRQKGYTEQEIKDGIREMQKQNISFEASPFRNFFKNIGVAFREGRNVLEVFDGGMENATKEFEKVLIGLNPAYREKYGTGPKPLTEADAYKLKSKGLFGRDFTATDSDVIDNIFQEEGYSADGVLVNVPPTENSGVTIGGLDLGKSAGNIQEKLDILSKYIPEDQMEALKSLQGLVGQEAEKALSDSLSSKELDPSTWGMTDDTLRQIQSDFVSTNTIPSIAKKMGVSEKDLEELPEQVLTAITSMEFMTPGTNAIKAVAKAMKSGSKEDWLAAADMYENYYGSKDQVEEKLKDGRILQGNVDRAKRAAELIRSVYS